MAKKKELIKTVVSLKEDDAMMIRTVKAHQTNVFSAIIATLAGKHGIPIMDPTRTFQFVVSEDGFDIAVTEVEQQNVPPMPPIADGPAPKKSAIKTA